MTKKHKEDEIEESKDQQEVQETPETNGENTEAPQSTDYLSQIAELNDKYLRLYSEFDNYRKRTLKEKIETSKYASLDIITKLLPILDDFDRAIKAFDSSDDTGKALKDGILLIYNKFFAILYQQGLEQMRTLGESFDTDFHEAITQIPAPNPDQKGKIVDEILKGYLLHGKVIRYAKVVVGI
ncbi:MAG: nucleotide exchange factor GrpE [Bacteroidales bacterium]|nr:nucleotide exchange factor GrpE [Bacteroidales bacterium]MDD4603865.1 nucleotide exchange factor GrpE [Bacteroidales bacterium]